MKSEVYNMDCLEYMRTLPDKAFSLAIADPPYGIDIANRKGSIGQKKGQGRLTTYTKKDWDCKFNEEDFFFELFRISVNQIVFGGNYFTDFLPPSKAWIVWDKRQPEGISFAMAELAFTSFNRSTQMVSVSRAYIGNKVSNNDELAEKWIKIHPTQKPVPLYQWILSNYAKPGDTIFDPMMGSQSSRIAAFNMGYDYTGCEIDKEYFDKGCERFKKQCHGIIKMNNGDTITQTQLEFFK